MNLSDIYYLKLNLSLLSFNIDTSLNIESKEGIIDNNYTKEKLNNLIQKINILTFNKSNSSIMCQILYFLLMSYDLSYSNTLRLCYPVITLNDLKIFKETIYNIISNILPKIILCGKSLLDEACGKKLEKFLRNFSDYIISYKISKEINKKNIIYEQLLEYKNNNENNNILLNIKKNCIITQISNLREIIISKLKNINNIQNKWKINALNISKQLEKENEKNIKLKNKYNLIISGNKSRFSEICSLDRSTKIENHTNFIETINGLHQKFIKNEEFKNNIEYINNKENKDIIDSINSNIILNNNNNIIIKNSIEISKDKKELELLIKELKEKNDKNCELLFVLHEQINNLEQRLKEDNLKFIERNFKKIDNNNNNKEFESKTKKFGIALDEQIEKLKNIEIILNKLKNELV
jgi:hypothetical protein